jgi:coenzyme F420 hydrogenase subunit beta
MVFGNYKAICSARAADANIRSGAQDGGIVTAMFAYALEAGIIDGAIVAGPGETPWQPEPIIATTIDELLAARGTKYSICPNMSMIKEATRSYGLDKIGIVGTPCQMQALRKAQLYPVGIRDVPDKIALAIGIFCMENFPYEGIRSIVEDHCNVAMQSLAKVYIGKGKFWAYTNRGAVIQVPLKETYKYEQPACHVCLDYVANLADISTGSVGSPDGWSTVFVRTAQGDTIWGEAMKAGVFETQDIGSVQPGLPLLEKLANEKIGNSQKYIAKRAGYGIGKTLNNPYI